MTPLLRTMLCRMARRPVASVFIVALIVRVALATMSSFLGFTFDPDRPMAVGTWSPDEGSLLRLAETAAAGNLDEDVWGGYGVSLYRTIPVFVWPLKVLFQLFGPHRIIAQLLAAVCGAAAAAAGC